MDATDAPRCKTGQKVVYGVARRDPINVSCEVDADPPQVMFQWSLNNSVVVNHHMNGEDGMNPSARKEVLKELIPIKSFISVTPLKSIASYSPRTKYGYGSLHCWASNKVGSQSDPCTFQIVPAGTPEPVQNCLVGNQSTESLVVKCDPGHDGGLEQSFCLEVYTSGRGSLLSNQTSTTFPVFHVTGLPMSTPLVLVLFAFNTMGRSDSVALATSTLPFLNKGKNTFYSSFSFSQDSSPFFQDYSPFLILLARTMKNFSVERSH